MHKKPLIQQGWQRAIVTITASFLVSYPIILLAKQLPLASRESGPLGFLQHYVFNTIGFVAVVLLMRLILDKQSILSMGFSFKGRVYDVVAGAMLAILLLSVGTLMLVLLQFLFFTGITPNLHHLLWSCLLFVIVAFAEEIIFRGYLLNNLLSNFKPWVALFVSALIFALFHVANPQVSVLSVANIFVAGLLLGLPYLYTRNLWFSIALHFAWNFFQGPILGYEVSGFTVKTLMQQTLTGPEWCTGGSFGFEGSVVSLINNLLAIGFLYRVFNKKEGVLNK
jgi:membrane protease YdiL (CAAX protease family)